MRGCCLVLVRVKRLSVQNLSRGSTVAADHVQGHLQPCFGGIRVAAQSERLWGQASRHCVLVGRGSAAALGHAVSISVPPSALQEDGGENGVCHGVAVGTQRANPGKVSASLTAAALSAAIRGTCDTSTRLHSPQVTERGG